MKKILLFLAFATAPIAAAVPVSALAISPGTGCPFDATTCVPVPTEPTTTTRPERPPTQPDPGVQLCTISSNGTVKCEKIRPLQG
jgi:hypothetical protein